MPRLIFATLGAYTALALPAIAAEKKIERLPSFSLIANVKENSALSMDCEGDPLGVVDCAFTQVNVTVPDEAKVSQARAEMEADFKTQDRAKVRQEICSLARELSKRAPQVTPAQRMAVADRVAGGLRKACECKDEACFLRETIEALLTSERKCKIWANQFKVTLKRVQGEHKWISATEPAGLCNVVNATVVESDDKGIMWKFTQTRLSADTSTEYCRVFSLNEPAVYATGTPSDALLSCEIIGFEY